jgi:hypothetical protein
MSRNGERALKIAPRAGQDRRAQSEVMVARRYVEHGFLDAALRIFVRRVTLVVAQDWSQLVDRLLERGRVADAVRACQIGDLPLPREQLLALGDEDLHRRNVDEALHYYELADADQARWSALVDVLTRLPGHELRAVELTQRYLVADEAPAAITLAASA